MLFLFNSIELQLAVTFFFMDKRIICILFFFFLPFIVLLARILRKTKEINIFQKTCRRKSVYNGTMKSNIFLYFMSRNEGIKFYTVAKKCHCLGGNRLFFRNVQRIYSSNLEINDIHELETINHVLETITHVLETTTGLFSCYLVKGPNSL